MDKNILVIGNGFDIYHELPTKYIEFVKYTRDLGENKIDERAKSQYFDLINIAQKNMFVRYFQKVAEENDTWIDCEQEIKRLVSVIFKAINIADWDGENDVVVYGLSSGELAILSNASKLFTVNIEESNAFLDSEYAHLYYVIKKDLIIKNIREELYDLIKLLEDYLLLTTNKPITKTSSQIEHIRWDYVINFNYTDTYKHYGIKDENVLFIHGRLRSIPNNMVLGFEDDEEDNLDSIYFKKYFQRIQKLTGNLDKDRFKPNIDTIFDENESVDVIAHFFGLSMSRTDGDMIREISELSTKIIVYYCSAEDYAQKVVNLIDVFGKKEATDRIQSGKIGLVEIV